MFKRKWLSWVMPYYSFVCFIDMALVSHNVYFIFSFENRNENEIQMKMKLK